MGSDQSADAPALRVEHLVKIFRHPQGGDLRAVDDITFEVERGGIFGLLGPNGAGKTTTLEMIEGIQPPDSGNIRVLGIDSVHDPDGIKRLMGVQLQTSAYPERLRLLEILDFLGVPLRKANAEHEAPRVGGTVRPGGVGALQAVGRPGRSLSTAETFQ